MAEGRQADEPQPRQSWPMRAVHELDRGERRRTCFAPAGAIEASPTQVDCGTAIVARHWRVWRVRRGADLPCNCHLTGQKGARLTVETLQRVHFKCFCRITIQQISPSRAPPAPDQASSHHRSPKLSCETMPKVTMAGLEICRAPCLAPQPARDVLFRLWSRPAFDCLYPINPKARARALSSVDRPPPIETQATAIARRRRQDPRSCQTTIRTVHGTPQPTTRC